MKVMIGEFITESNEHIPHKCNIKDYDIAFGKACIDKMRIKEVFDKHQIDIIPSIYANAGSNGVVEKIAFEYIESTIIKIVKENIHDIDGIFLMLHGASEVETIGSGDHHILKEIRKIVGPYLPIAVVCDPHGNLEKEYVESTQIIRSYRESPHTDADEPMVKVADMLCDLLQNRQNIHSVYRKLPLILGGEQSVSADEPVCSINKYLDELEKDEAIKSASWHVGYIRHDSDVAGCGVVVVPEKESDLAYAEKVADQLADYVWNKRHEFHYTGLTMQPEEALKAALDFEGKPVFITDSGDNVTSGAGGWNTFVLKQVLNVSNLSKSFLFATICDPNTYHLLENKEIGEQVHITLGIGYDELSSPVELDITIKSKGKLVGFMMHDHNEVFGETVNVTINNTKIDIMIASTSWAVCEQQQFIKAGIDWDAYDVIVVKEGYIFPELKAKGKLSIMSLTQGATLQDTAALPFKRIMRPMYPKDNI